MIVGFTGTRTSLTSEQLQRLNSFMDENEIIQCMHGDCIGADETFHNICSDRNIDIIIHPPKKSTFRAFCFSNKICVEKDYLERNRNIVNNCDILISFPSTKKYIPKSGTWYTINYAKKLNKPHIIFFPDGTFKNNL